MKRGLILLIVLCFSLAGCTKKEEEQPAPVLPQAAAMPESASESEAVDDMPVLEALLVQRSGQEISGLVAGFTEGLEKENLLKDIERLSWIVPRGMPEVGEAQQQEEAGLPAVLDSKELSLKADRFDQETVSSYTWVRLVYEAYIPPEGTNALSHKDIMIFLDPDRPEDAILAFQGAENNDQWETYRLSGYGDWLEKEIDMLLRVKLGM